MSIKATARKSGKKNQVTTRTKIIKINTMIEKWTITKKNISTIKKGPKKSSTNYTEEVIYDKLFIWKTSNQNYDSETFIADSGATSHMLNPEENTKNRKDKETQVTLGDSRTLTRVKRGN